MIQFQDWGEVPYNEAWERQEQIFSQTIDRKLQGKATENTMIFCEHSHVYTLGKSGDEHNLLIDYIQMQAAGAQFVKTNRGGDITYHGPGQIVGYPVFDLNSFNIGLKKYIELLEEVVVLTLKDVGIYAERFPGATGVWLDVGKPSARKICAIGVRSSRFVTMHGFALNVNTDLTYFSHINPCGFVDKGVTSVQKELGHSVDVEMIKSKLKLSFQQVFLIKK